MPTNLMKTWSRWPSICVIVKEGCDAGKNNESTHEFHEQKSGGFDGENYIRVPSLIHVICSHYRLAVLHFTVPMR